MKTVLDGLRTGTLEVDVESLPPASGSDSRAVSKHAEELAIAYDAGVRGATAYPSGVEHNHMTWRLKLMVDRGKVQQLLAVGAKWTGLSHLRPV